MRPIPAASGGGGVLPAPIDRWKFSEGSGPTTTSVKGVVGTLEGDAAFSADVPGVAFPGQSSMAFSGAGDVTAADMRMVSGANPVSI